MTVSKGMSAPEEIVGNAISAIKQLEAENKALKAEIERLKELNQKQYDEGYAHGRGAKT